MHFLPRAQESLHSAASECCIFRLQQLCWKVEYYISRSALHAQYSGSQMTLVLRSPNNGFKKQINAGQLKISASSSYQRWPKRGVIAAAA